MRKSLTPAEWRAIAPSIRLSERRKKAAYNVLVKGGDPAVVAEKLGLYSKDVIAAVENVAKRFDEKLAPASVRITPDEWEALLPYLTRLSERRRQAAHDVLVLGHTQANAGQKHGVFRQAVQVAVKNVLRHFEKVAAITPPPGWKTVTVTAPKKLITEFKIKIDKAWKDYEKQS